jgi:2-haloacid dehalogenase
MSLTSSYHEKSDDLRDSRIPGVVLFDVNETLSDMGPMAARFVDVGAPAHLAATWFASLLRDGFALTAAGGTAPFARIGAGALRVALQGRLLNRSVEEGIAHIMGGFAELNVHDDVRDGVPALAALGSRLVTLSNGATAVAEQLLARAGIRDVFERLLSVEDAGTWKPASAAYAYAATQCDVAPEDMMLIAVHPWDIDGAQRAGLRTAWINRTGATYPDYFHRATLEAASMTDLAELLHT